MLAQHRDASIGREMIVVRIVSAAQARFVTSSTSCQRLELFSSGLNRRKLREIAD